MADILLVTTWDTPCGIAEHSAMLKKAVEHEVSVQVCDQLAPELIPDNTPIIHLNYHAALHSLFTPDWIKRWQRDGRRVVITYHDTGVPNSQQCKDLCDVADAFIVHEPAPDLVAMHIDRMPYYIRMGVPDWTGYFAFEQSEYSWCGRRPILGSIGFPFPWKNYDELAKVSAACGWALLLIAPGATDEQVAKWKALNPRSFIITEFLSQPTALNYLSGCDATAFTYVCHNTGQSGAILQGIAARKPVIALKTCRQFRALYNDPVGKVCIYWTDSFEGVAANLREVPIGRVDPRTVALAEQESWRHAGQKYLTIYKRFL